MNELQQATFDLLEQYCADCDYDLAETDSDVDGEAFTITDDSSVSVDIYIDDTGDLDTCEAEHLIGWRSRELANEVIEGVYELRDESEDTDELNFDPELNLT
jgi:hypothetical protein